MIFKLIIITNRLPINPSFNEFVNCVTTIKRNPNPFFVRYDMNKVLVDSGGIANKFITNAAGIKDISNSLHMVTYDSGPNENNIFVWKVDSKNTDPQSAFDYGIQIFCMNYQSYDQAMQKYLNTELNPKEFPGKTFSNSSFIRKPANMISLPKPPKSVYSEPKQLGLGTGTKSFNSDSYAQGWFSSTI